MPELPEVETIKRDLEKEILGKRIKLVEVSGLRSIRRRSRSVISCSAMAARKKFTWVVRIGCLAIYTNGLK